MNKLTNILSKYQSYFLGLAIFLSLFAVSISMGDGQIQLNLQNYPLLMVLLVVASIGFALIYVSIDKRRITQLSSRIKEESLDKSESFESLLSNLTVRQKEVYDQILAGKTNKEIMADLFIEQSTLKTHINQIYKKLNITSRRELRSNSKG